MNQDEIQLVAGIRPEAPPYDNAARAAARRRLSAAEAARPRWRRPYTIALTGALAVAVTATTAQVLRQDAGAPPVSAPAAASARSNAPRLPKLSKMSAGTVLGRAAKAASDALRPRDDQFVVVESQTMYGAFTAGAVNRETGEESGETRYLYRTRRTIWQSADGTRDGVLKIEYLTPEAYPGWPLPREAHPRQATRWHALPVCGGPIAEHYRTHYTALKRLPADPEAMRAWLYAEDNNKNPADDEAWTTVGDLLRETYLPAAQRAALFRAAGTIPGVTVAEDAEDAAGRKGIGVGRVSDGVREELVFDPATYELLGERGVVVDAKEARSPAGALVASTAQLKVSVADAAPPIDDPEAGC